MNNLNLKIKNHVVHCGRYKGYIHHRVWLNHHKVIDKYYHPTTWQGSEADLLLSHIFKILH